MNEIKTLNPRGPEGAGAAGEPAAPMFRDYERTWDTGPKKLVIKCSASEKCCDVDYYVYPIYPYGNYVNDGISIYEKDGKIMIFGATVRYNWNGTGRDDWSKPIELTNDEARKILDTIYSINSIDDFEKLRDLYFELKEQREKKLEEAIKQVVEEVIDFLKTSEMLENIKLYRDELKEYLIESAREWLSG